VGSRFLVLGRSRAAFGQTADWWSDELDARVALLADFNDPTLDLWFERHRTEVVVVRPDRYVLGTANNLDRITASIRDLLTGDKIRAHVKPEVADMRAR
jgi:hypothetical protein